MSLCFLLCGLDKQRAELNWTWIAQHKSYIQKNEGRPPEAWLFDFVRDSVCRLLFMGTETVKLLSRGGDRDKTLLQKVAY